MATKRFNSDIEQINFDTTKTGGNPAAGQLLWDNSEKSLIYGTGVDSVVNVIGQEVFAPLLTNNSGVTINDGEAVRFDSNGDLVKAQADTLANSNDILGLATHDIEDGTDGLVTEFGVVNNVDTSSFTVGDTLYVDPTTAGALTNVRPALPVEVGRVLEVNASTGRILVNVRDQRNAAVTLKDYGLNPGNAGSYYAGGFYIAPAADANLTNASTTQTLGTANVGYAAHAFVVAGAAGTTDGSDLVLTVTGTSIDDEGTVTGSDSQVIVADCTASATDQYYETSKKWLGQVTYTLSSTGGTTFSYDFNYGYAKYDDIGNRDFRITDFEAVGRGAGNETDLDIRLIKHQDTGWTYSAAAFEPLPNVLCSLGTDYGTADNLITGQGFAYKRTDISTTIDGSDSEGFLIRVDTAVNNSIGNINCHVGLIL